MDRVNQQHGAKMFVAIMLGSLFISILGISSINERADKIRTDTAKLQNAQIELLNAQTAKIKAETDHHEKYIDSSYGKENPTRH